MSTDEAMILSGCNVLPPMDDSPHQQPPRTESKKKDNRLATGDRFQTLNNFVDFTLQSLTRADIVVWMILFRDTRDGIANTSQAHIALRAGTSDRTVRTSIKRLESLGLLKVVYRGGLNRGSSRYRVSSLIAQSQRKPTS